MLPKRLPFISSSVILVLILALPLFAQDGGEPTDRTLNGQYNDLIDRLEGYNEYKMIKKADLSEFWRVVSDSIEENRKTQKETLSIIMVKEAQIEGLNKVIGSKNIELASGEEEKSSIYVLGVQLDKSTYAIVSILIPFALLVCIGLLIYKLRSNVHLTISAVKSHAAVEAEYEEYKKNALETQMKLKRELQTERNKLLEVGR